MIDAEVSMNMPMTNSATLMPSRNSTGDCSPAAPGTRRSRSGTPARVMR